MIYIILFLAVIIGSIVVLFTKPSKVFTQILLAFSGAYLLSITILHLMPEVFENHNHKAGLFILLGVLIQSILEYFSKGIEHGHVHIHQEIKKIPWLLFISLSFHAFFEGIPLANSKNMTLVWAIFIHKIPITIVLTAFLMQTKLKKIIIFTLLLIFAIMSPLGLILSENIEIINEYHAEITAIIVGVFLHISSIILFESSENHTFNFKKFMAIVFGFLIAYLSLGLH
ncbi:MAG: ZIP family metal transporter [Flavobacteriaceae bacterium]|nr:ZIP family metal transporter [Flavobacteriaceae bacterium]